MLRDGARKTFHHPADAIAAGLTLVPGDVFTIAGVYAVNPQTRESTGALQQFVVQNSVTSASTELSQNENAKAQASAPNTPDTCDNHLS